MAVAAHVSRVSKDYAPHGYSINQSISNSMSLPTGTNTHYYIPVAMATDADAYLEDMNLYMTTALPADGTNFWTFTLVTVEAGAAHETVISSTTLGGTGVGIDKDSFNRFVITAPVVAKDKIIALKAVSNHNSSPALEIALIGRIRRKA